MSEAYTLKRWYRPSDCGKALADDHDSVALCDDARAVSEMSVGACGDGEMSAVVGMDCMAFSDRVGGISAG